MEVKLSGGVRQHHSSFVAPREFVAVSSKERRSRLAIYGFVARMFIEQESKQQEEQHHELCLP